MDRRRIMVAGGGSGVATALSKAIIGRVTTPPVPHYPRQARDLADLTDGVPVVRDWEFRRRKGERPK